MRGLIYRSVLFFATGLVLLAGCSSEPASLPPAGANAPPGVTNAPPVSGSSDQTQTFQDDPTVAVAAHGESASSRASARNLLSTTPTVSPTPSDYFMRYNPEAPDGTDFAPGGDITSAKIFEIDVNKSSSYYGGMGTFWQSTSGSSLIHVVDQYIGPTTPNRYPFGGAFEIKKVPTNSMTLATIGKILAAYVKHGDGFSAIYNIYLPKGANLTTPDLTLVPSGTACGFHGALDVTIKGTSHHFIYAVHSYPGSAAYCDDATFVHSLVTDTNANDTLHEVAEAITDPNGFYNNELGWYEQNFNGEVADLCQDDRTTPYTLADGSRYVVQSLFSNITRSCVFSVP
jgi:hypothetical protein